MVAARAALRALPYIVEAKNAKNFSSDILLPVFWTVTTSWVARKYPTHDVAAAAFDSAAFAASRASAAAFDSAADSAAAAAFAASRAAAFAADSATTSAADFASASATAIWRESLQDCAFFEGALTQDESAEQAARDLAGQPLWRSQSMPSDFAKLWKELQPFLLNEGDDWQVWKVWYQARLDGGKTINVPDDLLETLDVSIATLDEALWRQGPAAVNAKIKRLMDKAFEEAREREATANESASSSDESQGSVPAESANQITTSRVEQNITAIYSNVHGLKAVVEKERLELEAERPNSDLGRDTQQEKVAFLLLIEEKLGEISGGLSEIFEATDIKGEAEETARILNQLRDEFEKWIRENKPELVDWFVRLPSAALMIGLFSLAGANMFMATPFVLAAVGGTKFVEAYKEFKGNKNKNDDVEK